MHHKLSSVAILISICITMIGCQRVLPVYNIKNAPISSVTKTTLTLDHVSQTIIDAGKTLNWKMREVKPGIKPGNIIGTLYIRNHAASIDIRYTTLSYSIFYRNSQYLFYDPEDNTIHKNYNLWIQELDNAIRKRLVNL